MNAQATTVNKLVPMSFGQGWQTDYNNPYGFGYFVFNGESIGSCEGAYDEALLGMSQSRRRSAASRTSTTPPSRTSRTGSSRRSTRRWPSASPSPRTRSTPATRRWTGT